MTFHVINLLFNRVESDLLVHCLCSSVKRYDRHSQRHFAIRLLPFVKVFRRGVYDANYGYKIAECNSMVNYFFCLL